MSIRRGFNRLGKLAFVLLPLFFATVFVFQRPIVDIAAASDSYPADFAAFSSFGPTPPEKWGNDSPLWSPLLATPAQVGQWSPVMSWTYQDGNQKKSFVAIHAAMLPDGRILMWDRDPDNTKSAQIWNPNTGKFTPAPYNLPGSPDLFCAGFTLLPDGRLMVAGGHVNNTDDQGLNELNAFNTRTLQWSFVTLLKQPRWYPTTTILGDGRVLISGGAMYPDGGGPVTTSQGGLNENAKPEYVPAHTVEIFDPQTNQTIELSNASAKLDVYYYPQFYQMPTGNRVFLASRNDANLHTGPITGDDDGLAYILNLDTQIWTALGTGYGGVGTSSVAYLPGKILSTGGLSLTGSHKDAAIVDLRQPIPTWTPITPMNNARNNHTLVVLPDGTVMVVGGTTSIANQIDYKVLEPELWNPTTGSWTKLPSMTTPRMYHSIALLLPSGQVLVAGGGRGLDFPNNDQPDFPNAEIYSPAYLFKGARPTITSISRAPITAGSTIQIQTPQAASIKSAAFISLPSVTHAFNENQRYVPLTFLGRSGSIINAQLPANRNFVPPGFYMLFIVNRDGVPSVATIIRVD